MFQNKKKTHTQCGCSFVAYRFAAIVDFLVSDQLRTRDVVQRILQHTESNNKNDFARKRIIAKNTRTPESENRTPSATRRRSGPAAAPFRACCRCHPSQTPSTRTCIFGGVFARGGQLSVRKFANNRTYFVAFASFATHWN